MKPSCCYSHISSIACLIILIFIPDFKLGVYHMHACMTGTFLVHFFLSDRNRRRLVSYLIVHVWFAFLQFCLSDCFLIKINTIHRKLSALSVRGDIQIISCPQVQQIWEASGY